MADVEGAHAEAQQDIQEFGKKRQQLMMVGSQKQQVELQQAAFKAALEELKQTSEKKVYKAVGNILVLKDTAAVTQELTESVDKNDLRLKTLEKQEQSLINRLNKLKMDIEAKAGKGE